MNKNYYIIKLFTITTLIFSTFSLIKADNFNLKEEQKKLSNRIFGHYDQDKNGLLSFEEFSAFSKDMKRKELEKRVGMIIRSCDKNKNGAIELSEVPTQEERMKLFEDGSFSDRKSMCNFRRMEFKEIDQNEDNISTKEELIKFNNQSHFRIPKITKPNKTEIKKRELDNFKRQLKRCDKNHDKNITLIEITSNICFMTSDIFLQYSSDPKGSFEIEKIVKAPKYDRENDFISMIDRCDKNKDKKLNLVEATSNECHLSSNEFSQIDTDKSTFIVKSELIKKKKQEMKPIPRGLNDTMMKHMPPQIQIRMVFSICDKNHDRNFTISEAKDCNLSMEKFKTFDTDNSQSIELNDIEEIRIIEGFKMGDINKDKKIDIKEFSERMGNSCRIF